MSRVLSIVLGSLAAAALALSASAAGAGPDSSQQYRIENLSVAGGSDSWRSENLFQLSWSPLPAAEFGTIDSVDYLVRDSDGNALRGPITSGRPVTQLPQVQIPPDPDLGRARPGRYTVEVWIEGQSGSGPHASTTLRFDDSRPAPARALSPAGWIRAGAEATVEIEPPAELPASGIRGYAVALDHGSGALPCAGPDSCSEAEIDLLSGAGHSSVSLGALAEGTNVAVVVAVSGSGLRSTLASRTALHVDGREPIVAIGGAPRGWSDRSLALTATATDSESGVAAAGPAGAQTSISVDGGVPTVAAGGSVTAMVWGDGVHRVAFYGRDAVGNSGEGRPAWATVKIDKTPPVVAFAGSQQAAEPERIEAGVSDSLSGASPDEGSIAIRPAGSTAPFEPLPTRVSAGRLTAFWDSDSYPVGSYEFRATGYDAAGNSARSDRRSTGARMVLANPVKGTTGIEFGFGGRQMVWHHCRRGRKGVRCRREVISAFERRPATRSVPYGRAVPVAGRLLAASGSPLAGQPVELTESFAPGARAERRTTTVKTNADGAYLARLAAGPSRSIRVSFAGTGLLTRSAGRTLQLGVRTAIHFRASSAGAAIGGRPVVFSGKVAHGEAEISAAGRPVELQFRVPGAEWSEFRTVQTDPRGRFRYPYAFSDDDSRGVRFEFRAYAPAQPGWPYEPGASRPVVVTGR